MKKKLIKVLALIVVSLLNCVFVVLPGSALGVVDTAWVSRYNGPSDGDDASLAMAIDDSGGVYVTGYSVQNDTSLDYVTIKYLENGDTAWVRRYNGPGDYVDIAYGIAVDSYKNVYVTGESEGVDTRRDYATIRYYPNGDTAWVRRYTATGNGLDGAHDVVVDASDNVYVTGLSRSGPGTFKTTVKYHSNGDSAWVRSYKGPGELSWAGGAMTTDLFGFVYVTGKTYSDTTTRDDYVTIKYAQDGDTLWARKYNGPGDYYDAALSITADESSKVYVTGYSYGDGSERDFTTIKYHSNGNAEWVQRYNGPGNYWDVAFAITIDTSGNVYVTGLSRGSGTSDDYATIK